MNKIRYISISLFILILMVYVCVVQVLPRCAYVFNDSPSELGLEAYFGELESKHLDIIIKQLESITDEKSATAAEPYIMV